MYPTDQPQNPAGKKLPLGEQIKRASDHIPPSNGIRKNNNNPGSGPRLIRGTPADGKKKNQIVSVNP